MDSIAWERVFQGRLNKQILETNEFNNEVYKILIESYKFLYSDLELSELDESKITILIDTGRLMPETEVYEAIVQQCMECAIKFMERYIDKYFEDELNVNLESEVFIGLLKSTKLSKENKKAMIEKCSDFDFNELKQIVQFYMDEKEDIPNDIFRDLFYSYSEDNIKDRLSLLAYNIENINFDEASEYLYEFGTPYSEILERTLKNLNIDYEENIWKIVKYMSKVEWIGKVNINKKKNKIVINRREKDIVGE